MKRKKLKVDKKALMEEIKKIENREALRKKYAKKEKELISMYTKIVKTEDLFQALELWIRWMRNWSIEAPHISAYIRGPLSKKQFELAKSALLMIVKRNVTPLVKYKNDAIRIAKLREKYREISKRIDDMERRLTERYGLVKDAKSMAKSEIIHLLDYKQMLIDELRKNPNIRRQERLEEINKIDEEVKKLRSLLTALEEWEETKKQIREEMRNIQKKHKGVPLEKIADLWREYEKLFSTIQATKERNILKDLAQSVKAFIGKVSQLNL